MIRTWRHRLFTATAIGLVLAAVPVARATAVEPAEDLRALVEAASELEKAGRWPEAREAWLALAEEHPRERRVQFGLERVHKWVEDDGRYLAWLREQIGRAAGDPVLFRQYLAQSVRAGDLNGLDEAIERHREAGQGNDAFYRELGAQLGRLSLTEREEAVLLAGRRARGDATRFARELSDLYYRTGRYPDSLDEALEALRGDPGAVGFARRRLEDVAGRMTDADRLARVAAFTEGPGNGMPAFLDLLAGLQADTGPVDAALATLRRLGNLDPEAAAGALETLAVARESAGLPADALEARRQLARIEPGNRPVHEMEIARLYRAMGRQERAVEAYRELLESDPGPERRDRILVALGQTELYGRHRPGAAIAWFDRIDPQVSDADAALDAAVGLAVARASAGDLDEAVRAAARAAALPPPAEREIEVAFLEAETEIAAGRVDRGRSLLDRVARRRGHPLSNDAIEMTLWIDRCPDDEGIPQGLVLYRLTRKAVDAGQSIRRLEAIRKRCGDCALGAETRLELADVYRGAERAGEAIAELESILDDFPEHRLVPRVEWTLAGICRDLGDAGRARAHLERILRDFGSSAYAPRARRALEAMERAGGTLGRAPTSGLGAKGGATA